MWDGKKLSYIQARKTIYFPLYAEAVSKTKAFAHLKDIYENTDVLVLQDFDAHNIDVFKFDLNSLVNNEKFKVGHGYVLAMLLMGTLP